jgi:hypothetical protein
MGFDDVDKSQAPKADTVDVRKVSAARDSANDPFWDLFKNTSSDRNTLKGIAHDEHKEAKITNLGAIAELALPAGWVAKGDHSKGDAHFYNKEFILPSAEARLSVSYRGTPVKDVSAANFMRLLAEPDHKLTGAELASVEEVLRTRSSEANFQVNNAYTRKIDDQRVLMVEGQVPGKVPHDSMDECIMYIPADRKGSVIQEVAYRAPHQSYGAYINTIKNAFDNMEFR